MLPSKSKTVQKRESLWKLGGLTLWHLNRNVIRAGIDDCLLERASGLAFDFFLALFPLLFLLLTLFGLFASHSTQLQSRLLAYFAEFLPPAGFEILRTSTEELAKNASGKKLTAGILVALWFASGGVVSMISTLNVVYHVREARSWFKVRAIALGLLLALPAAILFMVTSYSVMYYFGPDLRERRWHWISPGSAIGVLLWLAASAGFRIYLHYFNSYTATYGSLGALIILLVWLYVTGLAFLIGGEVNAEIERAEAGPKDLRE